MNPQWLLWLRYYAVFQNLARLPLPLAYRAASRIGQLDYQRQPAARQYIETGMQQILPAHLAGPAQREQYIQAYFGMMARELLDTFVMVRMRPQRQHLLTLAAGSLDVLHAARRGGRGVIIAMNHYSRINMLLLALALAGERLGMLTMVTDERNRDLDPVSRRYLQFKIGTLVHFIQGRWITLADDMRVLYQALAQGETIVLLLDSHTPDRVQKKLHAPFFEGSLSVARGVARLAEKTGAGIVYGVPHENGWRINAELRSLPEDPYQAVEAAVGELQRDIIRAPWAWWNWNTWQSIWTPN